MHERRHCGGRDSRESRRRELCAKARHSQLLRSGHQSAKNPKKKGVRQQSHAERRSKIPPRALSRKERVYSSTSLQTANARRSFSPKQRRGNAPPLLSSSCIAMCQQWLRNTDARGKAPALAPVVVTRRTLFPCEIGVSSCRHTTTTTTAAAVAMQPTRRRRDPPSQRPPPSRRGWQWIWFDPMSLKRERRRGEAATVQHNSHALTHTRSRRRQRRDGSNHDVTTTALLHRTLITPAVQAAG